MKTKPRDEWANFDTECHVCTAEISVTNGRVTPHHCQPSSLAEIRDALGK